MQSDSANHDWRTSHVCVHWLCTMVRVLWCACNGGSVHNQNCNFNDHAQTLLLCFPMNSHRCTYIWGTVGLLKRSGMVESFAKARPTASAHCRHNLLKVNDCVLMTKHQQSFWLLVWGISSVAFAFFHFLSYICILKCPWIYFFPFFL